MTDGAHQRIALMETLALGNYFEVERDRDGQPVRMTPVDGRVEFDGTSYIVRKEPSVGG